MKTHIKQLLYFFFSLVLSHSYAQITKEKYDLTPTLNSSLEVQHNKSKTAPINDFIENLFPVCGLTAGQETIFGIKYSMIKPFSFIETTEKPKYGFYPKGAYVGLDLNGFMFFGIWGGIGINTGLSLGAFTLDNSINYLILLPPLDTHVRSQTTLNPKLGVHYKGVWLKAGPSFLIGKNSVIPDWVKIKGYNINFEINYIIRLF